MNHPLIWPLPLGTILAHEDIFVSSKLCDCNCSFFNYFASSHRAAQRFPPHSFNSLIPPSQLEQRAHISCTAMKLSSLSSAFAAYLFVASSFAQDSAEPPKLSSAVTSASETQARATGGNTNTRTTNTASATEESIRRSSTVAITGSGISDTATGAVPTITGGADATEGGDLVSGLPTLSGAFKIYPASVPPIAGAPYMRQSTLPEGTVFIIVGAILGFLALGVLLWRALVAWSLHRSVKRASKHQIISDTKALFGQKNAPMYSNYKDQDSTTDLSAGGGKAGRKANRPSSAAPNSAAAASLFFSPTAGAMNNSGARGSNYLPAGYYAAGASAPGNNQSHVTVGGQGPSISLSNLAHQSQGYSRARSMGPSPPESPMVSAEPGYANSSSSLNLNKGYGGDARPPSAYIDEMFNGIDGASPHAPQQYPPQQYSGHRSSQHGRF